MLEYLCQLLTNCLPLAWTTLKSIHHVYCAVYAKLAEIECRNTMLGALVNKQ